MMKFEEKQLHEILQNPENNEMNSISEEICQWEDEGGAIIAPKRVPAEQWVKKPLVSPKDLSVSIFKFAV